MYQNRRREDRGEALRPCSAARASASCRAYACKAALLDRASEEVAHFVDARVLSIFEGAEEAHALKVIARRLLDDA